MKSTINRYTCIVPRFNKTFWFVFAIAWLGGFFANGQLIQVPLERPGVELSKKTRISGTARTKDDDPPLLLPFFDDFSFTPLHNANIPDSGFPSPERWHNSSDVWINEGLGINPPSRNVATLDGLMANGRPYSNQVLDNGYRDVLTSRAIDMSTARVGIGERPGVYLSFFYQWQGNGEAPDANDYFLVEFLDKDSIWHTAATIATLPSNVKDEFIQVILQVDGADFFHDRFRFRFRNYGRLSGPFDTWNLDYIYLNKGRNENNLTYADRAIASSLTPIFGPYYSVPLPHYREAPVYTAPLVDVKSLRPGPSGTPTDYNVLFTFNNYASGVLTPVTKAFGPVGSKYPDNNLLPGERFRSTIRTDSDVINFNDPAFIFDDFFRPDADSISLRVALDVYEPDLGMFTANDTVSMVYHLNDYYAYDDGSAEYAVVLSQPDDQVAYRFDLLTDEPQELVGFDVYIPAYSLGGGFTTAEFFVMDAEDGEPNVRLTSITHIARTNSRDGFQRVNIEPVVVKEQFFIGWKGSFNNRIRVGMDYSNTTVDRIYEDINGVIENGKLKWFPVNLTEGSLMIRPNFGDAGLITGTPREKIKFTYYPNPSNGIFYIEGIPDHLEIISVSGQRILFQQDVEDSRVRVTLPNVQSGVFLLRMRKGDEHVTGKLIIQ